MANVPFFGTLLALLIGMNTTTATTATTAATTGPPASTTGETRPLAGRVIVVDPGHNGANAAHPTETGRPVDAGGFTKPCNTTGAAEGDLTESRFNWETAQRLRTALESAGATVVLTRTSDDGWGPCVDQRGLTGRADRTDALVSIHADGADPEGRRRESRGSGATTARRRPFQVVSAMRSGTTSRGSGWSLHAARVAASVAITRFPSK